MTDGLADRLTDFVEVGGELLLGPCTGVKDEYNKLRPTPQPGPLADLVGATVDQHESLPPRIETRVRRADDPDGRSETYPFRTWAEWLETDAAEPLFAYDTDGVESGRTAAVRNAVGDGSVVYCGVWPEADLADDLVRPLLERAGVAYGDRLPDAVRVGERNGRTWVMNFSSDRYRVAPDDDVSWLVGDATVGAFDVAVADGEIVDGFSVDRLE